MRRILLVAALIGVGWCYRFANTRQKLNLTNGDDELAASFDDYSVEKDLSKLGAKCEPVSRRRAFSTTCACRRRTAVDPGDMGVQCIKDVMQCPPGTSWIANRGCGDGSAPAPPPLAEVLKPPPPATTRAASTGITAKTSTVDNPVIEVHIFRAQEYDGEESAYALENVDVADLPGMIQYLHREIVTEHQVGAIDKETGKARTARKYDIDSMLMTRMLVKNPGAQTKVHQDFGGYQTYDYQQATNRNQWNEMETLGDFVGVQLQSAQYVPYQDPSFWYSMSGFCPNLPYTSSAITALCKEDIAQMKGTCTAKTEGTSKGCYRSSDAGFENCLCYKDGGGVVWGGLCGADATRSPPKSLEVPTGQRGCTYSYERTPVAINLDTLVGITNELCNGGQKCKDWNDFRLNCDNKEYKKTFTSMGNVKRVQYCVEYDLHPDCAQLGCSHRVCQNLPADKREIGLPFWQGRCNSRKNQERAEKAAEMFGIKDATSAHIISKPPTEEYSGIHCNRKGSLSCFPSAKTGDGYCTREWSGVCTACRIPGAQNPAMNTKTELCPWSVAKGEYKDTAGSTKHCKGAVNFETKPSEVCCLYSDACDHPIKIADVPNKIDEMTLDDDTVALAFATSNTNIAKKLLVRIAQELLGVSESDISAKSEVLDYEAYWSWGTRPLIEWIEGDVVRLKKVADRLNEIFPGSTVYTTTTTTTTTTTRARRTWKRLTTTRQTTTTLEFLPAECMCNMDGVVKGKNTKRAGCAKHLGRKFGNFCYIEGDKTSCGRAVRYSRPLGLYWKKCDPELEMGAP